VRYAPATLIRNEEYGPGHWIAELQLEALLPEIRAGQFFSLRCDPHDTWSLLRPFSFLDVNPVARTISVYYKHLGRLSTILSDFGPGTVLDVLYPLGKPFTWQEDWRRVAIVGGGVGMAPLLFLARELLPYGETMQVEAYFGGKTEEDLVPGLLGEYPELSLHIATDDGSRGHHGTVVDLFRRSLAQGAIYDAVYVCGPNPMMHALKAVVPSDVPCFASLEEYMACGVGACLGCTAHIEQDGQRFNMTTCKSGPVFPLQSVVFEL
jgi:dihydroorotate dehydrogenase electron transfer subunit